jgi:hypothetical protein
MKKLIFGIVIVILALFLILLLGKNMIAKIAVEKGVEQVTGLKLKTESFNIGIIKTFVGIKNLKLFNPAEYKDKIMFYMPEIFVDYNLSAMMKRKVYLEKVRMNLKEFTVVKNDKGQLNLNSLKPIETKKEVEKPKKKKKEKAPGMHIDRLELKIGKVIYKDYYKKETPSVREFNINLDEKYENITDLNSLVRLIVVKALMNTTIASLANFNIGPLVKDVSGMIKKEIKVDKFLDAGKDIKQKTEETTKEILDKTKDIFKKGFPFK